MSDGQVPDVSLPMSGGVILDQLVEVVSTSFPCREVTLFPSVMIKYLMRMHFGFDKYPFPR